jgi:hypothetical protein
MEWTTKTRSIPVTSKMIAPTEGNHYGVSRLQNACQPDESIFEGQANKKKLRRRGSSVRSSSTLTPSTDDAAAIQSRRL